MRQGPWSGYLDVQLELLTAVEDLQHSQCACQDTRLAMNHTCSRAHLCVSDLPIAHELCIRRCLMSTKNQLLKIASCYMIYSLCML